MAIMPDKPDSWAALAEWFHQHYPSLYATGLSGLIAVLRVLYDGGERRRVWLEGLLCAAITGAVVGGIELCASVVGIELPESMAAPVGGLIGLLGVEKVRSLAERYVDYRLDRRSDGSR